MQPVSLHRSEHVGPNLGSLLVALLDALLLPQPPLLLPQRPLPYASLLRDALPLLFSHAALLLALAVAHLLPQVALVVDPATMLQVPSAAVRRAASWARMLRALGLAPLALLLRRQHHR